MKPIKNSLTELINFESVDFKEGNTILSITHLPGKGVFISHENIEYFRNHVTMNSETWENFLYRFIYDKAYRAKHVVNKRWYGIVAR